jgi:transposase
VRGKVGRPRKRPKRLTADRGYDHDKYRHELRRRGITSEIARRQTEHDSGLGRYRWVVERTFAWLHQFKRLLVRYDKRADMHEAFLALACCLSASGGCSRHSERFLRRARQAVEDEHARPGRAPYAPTCENPVRD